jgi:hypothetical protein
MTRHKAYPVTTDERDRVLRDTFDTMAQIILEHRSRHVDLNSPAARARLDAIYPRMHWLYYDGVTTPIGDWRPTYYGLPADEPLIKPKGPTK